MPDRKSTPIPAPVAPDDPKSRLQLAMEHLRTQMPEIAPQVRSVSPMSTLEQLAFPRAFAATYPLGVVRYNPNLVPQDQSTVDDYLAHEYTHVGQYAKQGLMGLLGSQEGDYQSRPAEQEAFATETSRQATRKDIPLPRPPRKKLTQMP